MWRNILREQTDVVDDLLSDDILSIYISVWFNKSYSFHRLLLLWADYTDYWLDFLTLGIGDNGEIWSLADWLFAQNTVNNWYWLVWSQKFIIWIILAKVFEIIFANDILILFFFGLDEFAGIWCSVNDFVGRINFRGILDNLLFIFIGWLVLLKLKDLLQ